MPGLEPGPLKDKVLSLACLPISSHRHWGGYNLRKEGPFTGKIIRNRFSIKKLVSTKGSEDFNVISKYISWFTVGIRNFTGRGTLNDIISW